MVLFEPEYLGADPTYEVLRAPDNEQAKEARSFVDTIWEQTEAFLDRDLPEKIRRDFHAGFWELYLASCLLSAQIPLVPRSERGRGLLGPDIQGRAPACWLEAVTAKPGLGGDAVVERADGLAHDVPDDGRSRVCRRRVVHCSTSKPGC